LLHFNKVLLLLLPIHPSPWTNLHQIWCCSR